MSPDELLGELRAVLAAEREAIRKLDTSTIVAANEKKEALLAIVSKSEGAARPQYLGALALVRDELKRNLVLLAHARDFVRDAVNRARPQGITPGARLSIKL